MMDTFDPRHAHLDDLLARPNLWPDEAARALHLAAQLGRHVQIIRLPLLPIEETACTAGVPTRSAETACTAGVPTRSAETACTAGVPTRSAETACTAGVPTRSAEAACTAGVPTRSETTHEV